MSRRTLMLQFQRYAGSFAAVFVLIVVGVGAGFYLLIQERLPNPFTSYYTVHAEFPSAAGVVPGLGEPVDVAGVHVGQITATQLVDGRAVVTMEIDPSEGVPHLYRNASAALAASTPLKNMYVDIDPGSRSAGVLPYGGTIDVGNTTYPVDSDEVLNALDGDTRDWLTSLITALSEGTRGRGDDIRESLALLGPTAEQANTIGTLLADRRTDISGLVHNLGALASQTSKDDEDLASLVDGSGTTLSALGAQDAQIKQGIAQLPQTLTTVDTTLSNLIPFAHELAPTATALLPVARDLPTTLADSRSLVRAAALLPPDKLIAFENVVAPLTAPLSQLSGGLRTNVPLLTTSFKSLEYLANELAYDPGNGNPGFLYWFAWFAHNSASFLSNSDANGAAWRTLLMTNCSTLESVPADVATLIVNLLGQVGCGISSNSGTSSDSVRRAG